MSTRYLAAVAMAMSAIVAIPQTATAKEVAGIELPDSVLVNSLPLLLNGAGIRKEFIFNAYVAALYTTVTGLDAKTIINSSEPHSLRLTLLRDITVAALADALDKGLMANASVQERELLKVPTAHFRKLMSTAGEGLEGDTIVLDFEGAHVSLAFKGQKLGKVKSPVFAAALMRVWLGSAPVQASLKTALLGRH